MKTTISYLIMAAFFTLTACTKDDDFDGEIEVFDPPVFSDATPVDSRIKAMNEQYNVIFKPSFEQIEYTWNWENRIAQTAPNVTGLRYTPADMNYVIPVIDSVEKWVFNIFPLEFSRKYMPLNILMTDSMGNKIVSGVNVVHRIYEGYIATNYILVPYVSARFDAQKTRRLLRESWLSLFVEKMLTTLPYPRDFAALSTTGYAKINFTNAEDVAALYGILKKGRLKQTSSTATSVWSRTFPAQDFGDYVAFIVYTPDAEKETVYAKNSMIRTKVALVKSYFLDNFGITLPYIPVQP